MAESDKSLPKKRNTTRAVAPSECPEFQRFLRAVEADSSVSAADMIDMFRDLGVYGHLTELGTISWNLLQVLDRVMARPSWHPYLEPVKKWPALLNWIVHHESIVPTSKYTSQTAGRNPLVHVCATSHPLYTLLWTSTQPNQLEEFRLLQGYVLIAHLLQVHKHAEYAYDYSSAKKAPYAEIIAGTYRSSVALREISLPGSAVRPDMLRPDRPPLQFAEEMLVFWQEFQGRNAEQRMIPSSDASEEYRGVADPDQELFDLLGTPIHRSLRTHLQIFCYVLAEVYELRKHGVRSRSRVRSRQSQVIHGYLPLLDTTGDDVEKPDDDPSKRSIRWRRGAEAATCLDDKPKGAPRYQAKFDIDEAENLGEEYVEVDPGCALAHKSVPSLVSLALRGKMQAEALQNQLLPWDYDLLTDTAVRLLLDHMSENFEQELEKSAEKPSGSAEAIALLSILLWTGCGLDVGRKIQIIKIGHKPGLGMLMLQTDSLSDYPIWRLRIAPPSYRSAAMRKLPAFADVSESVLQLPDIAQGSNYFLQLRQRYPDFKERGFQRSARQCRTLLVHYLKRVDPSGYLSLTKVEDYLWRRLSSTGDLAEADLIVGKQHRLSQVRRFYTTLAKDALVLRYRTVVTEILHNLSGQVEPSKDYSLTQCGHVGAFYRPTITAVQSAVLTLKNDLKEVSSKCPSDAACEISAANRWCRKYYKQYTLYTWFFFAYATAARATCRPFPQDPIPSKEDGFIVHSDKTTKDRSHVRLLWLPEALLQQLRDQRVFASGFEKKSSAEDEGIEGSNFFLTTRKRIPLCPKVLSPYLQSLFGHKLPVNSHRRFCRSYLLEVGCPTEIVDAFMGHWFSGESPWSRYSSQSAWEYAMKLKPYVTSMLEDLGLQFIKFKCSKQSKKH